MYIKKLFIDKSSDIVYQVTKTMDDLMKQSLYKIKSDKVVNRQCII